VGAILLVRHGQASFGAADYDLLSPSGEHQARRLGAALAARGVRPDAVISGSLQRQRASADALTGAAGWPVEVSVDASWDEFELSGLVPAMSEGQQPRDREAFQDALEAGMHRWAGATGAPRTGMSFADFSARAESGLRTAAERQPRGATTLVVTSAGVIGWLAASLLGAGVEQWVRLNRVCVNTGVSTLISGRRGISLVAFNDHSHLTPQEITYR
jgi:broad specificity phosphatase PhoE